MGRLELGIAIPQSFGEPAASVAALRAFMRRAEEVGLDSLWVQEQLIGHDRSFEPLAMLSYAAACTSRVRLCSATFVAPVRNPIVFAKSMATIDQLSLGRLTVGISLGDMRTLYPASGVPIERRVSRFEELILVMRRLWTEDRVTFRGRYFTLEDAAMEPKPIQKPHPPIWFGGHGDRALERAVRLGDGWIGAGGRSIAEFGTAAASLRELLAASPKPDFRIAKKLYLSVGRDRTEAFEVLRRWFTVHWAVPGWTAADKAALASRVGVYGTPRECLEQVLEAQRLGADLIILNPVHGEAAQLELIASEVIPALRERGADGGSGSREEGARR